MKRQTFSLLFFVLLTAAACQSAKQEGGAEDSTAAAAKNVDATEHIAEEERGASVELDAPLPLRYAFRKGDSFAFRIVTDQQVTQTQDTLEDINHQVINYWYRFEVLEPDAGGGGRLRVTCDRVTFELEQSTAGREREMAYDSQAENTDEIEKLYAQYNAPVNTPFEIVVESDGHIAAIENLGEVVKNFLRDDYETTKSDYRETIERDYAETGLKQILQLAFQKLPEKAIGKDSSWTMVRPEKLGYLEYRNDAEYRIRDIVTSPAGTLAHIDAQLNSMYTGSKKMDTGQGMATMDSFDVEGRGLTVFNLDEGRVRRRSLQTDVHVRMYVEPPDELKELAPEQARNFWWTQKARVKTTVDPYTP